MHPIFHNKQKLGLGLIIAGALFCLLPLLMSPSDSPLISKRLASEIVFYHSCWGEWSKPKISRDSITGFLRFVEGSRCMGTLADLRASVKSLIGFGMVLIGVGVFVRFSNKG